MTRLKTCLLTVACLIALTACDDMMMSQQDIELAAMQAALPDKAACAKGLKPAEMKPKAYLEFVKCMNKVAEDKIIQSAVYPDLMRKVMYTAQENAALYAKGDITFDQVEARRQLADSEYLATANQRYAGVRAQERAANAALLQSIQPKQPTYTHCSGSRYSMNCTSY